MSDRILKLLLIDPDPIFRAGLRVVIEKFPDLEVAAEGETSAAALQILAESGNVTIDLVVLELDLDRFQSQYDLSLQCQQLKIQYPNLPVLLLTRQKHGLLKVAQQAGIEGYCPKGVSVSDLVSAIRKVAAGESYWFEAKEKRDSTPLLPNTITQRITPGIFTKVRNQLRLSGLQQIDFSLAEVTAQLQIPGLSPLDRAFLAGQRRELLASRWLVNQLLATPEASSQLGGSSTEPQRKSQFPLRKLAFRDQGLEKGNAFKLYISSTSPKIVLENSSQASLKTIQNDLFESTLAKLQFSLQNLSGVPLEVDIFREEKKRELLELILLKVKNILDELHSQVQISQLLELQPVIMRDLWQAVITDFFGKYSLLQVGNRNLEIVNYLLQDAFVVQTAILNKIPLVVDLFAFLLFQTPLVIDNVPYAANSPEAKERAESILNNLLIQVANGVVQPLLNQFANVETIKQSFYDRRLISTREIEQFRNNLSWKYRISNYISEPKAIFESRYELFVLASRGIAKISIYAPRSQELAQLSGIPLAVTLALETRDAIAPRLQAAVAFLGSGIIYILTQVIGRAIGLVGRGILQGIGGSLSESKFGRNGERPK